MTAPPRRDHTNALILGTAIALGLAAAVLIGYGAYRLMSGSGDPAPESRDPVVTAAPTLAPGDTVAATVNGVPLGMGAVEARRDMLDLFPAEGVDPADTRAVLELVVTEEVIRQAASSRGVGPTEDEITEMIAADQRAFGELQAAGRLDPATEAAIDAHAAAGHPLDSWQDDPMFRSAYRAMLTAGHLGRALGGTGILDDSGEAAAALAALRASATVEILID